MKVTSVFFLLVSLIRAEPFRFGPERSFHLEHSADSFGMRSHGIIEIVKGRSKYYSLPQSTFEMYARLRAKDVAINPVTAETYERQEVIGPHQLEDGKLWFGNRFYDGEGERGVGAFGYFDTESRRYQLYSPPEVAPWEISALLVEQDAVWLALDHFGEAAGDTPGGLVRWDRSTHETERYPVEFGVASIERRDGALYLATRDGYATLRDGAIQRFAFRKAADGKTVAVPVKKFPEPPLHY
jgi:hypothetical protein